MEEFSPLKKKVLENPQAMEEIDALAQACREGRLEVVRSLLQKHPDVLDSPDFDTRFKYPESRLWSPLFLAAMGGHLAVVRLLLEEGANPVPYEVAAQYHDHTYHDWTRELRGRGFSSIAGTIETAISERYGPLLEGSDLREAVQEGDPERVRKLLAEEPGGLRQVDRAANTLLHVAVAANRLDMVRLLVDAGVPLDPCNGDGRTPAVVALYGLHRWWRDEFKPEILELLLNRGAEYSLLIAAALGDETRIGELVIQNPQLANQADRCHRRPLSAAVARGHTERVRFLLESGADPNAKEAICQGGLSLHTACRRGDLPIVRLLLEAGADPTHWVDSSGDAMFAAHHRGNREVLQLLYGHGGTMELAVYSAAHRIDMVAEILRLNPGLADQVLPYGWNDDGNQDLACDIMRLAIRYGARFENASEWKLRRTVCKYPRVFRLLQEHGAEPNRPLLGISGDQPRRWPDPDRHRRVVEFLVEECGADINCTDQDGLTPLALAARQGFPHLVEYFLSLGATLNPEAPAWAHPPALARRHGHQVIVEMLRQSGLF